MCGIVGYIGDKEAQPILVDGLLKLEYRGYDSSGIATLHTSDNSTNFSTMIRRSVGKISALEKLLQQSPCLGKVGIGHTRWATHGKPTEVNAHPHTTDGITVVHNGIIENYREVRERLVGHGADFYSQTDTEVICQLIAHEAKSEKDFLAATQKALKQLKGAYAVAIINEKIPDQIIGATMASPLVIGHGKGEMFIASDFPAVLAHTRDFYILEDADIAVITKNGVSISSVDGKSQSRKIKRLEWSAATAEKGGHEHFMHKEIFEQPTVVEDTLLGRLNFLQSGQELEGIKSDLLATFDRIIFVACGSSYHAAMVGKYYIEDLARVPVDVEVASEFRYRNVVLDGKCLVIGISQSGETADTLAALKFSLSRGAQIMSICNVLDSAITRLCQQSLGTLYTRAGLEIGVASTKALLTQIAAVQILSLVLAQQKRSLSSEKIAAYLAQLAQLPRYLRSCLALESAAKSIAKKYVHCTDMLYLGRGVLFPMALEGALKMKEISYVHAEGYAAGEMKHGPIALIDEKMPVVVLALKGAGYEKVVANIEEVCARGGKIIAIGEENDGSLAEISDDVLLVPKAPEFLAPALAAIPLQLLAYYMAVERGTDVDQPRNLAKSVTVE